MQHALWLHITLTFKFNSLFICRDLGEHLRIFINQAYKENKFEEHPKYWDRQYLSIKRLVDNVHKNKYKRSLSSSATGLSREECHTVLSTEVLQELEKEEKSVWKKIIPFEFTREGK